MIQTSRALDTLSIDHLARVTGGGLGSEIGKLFGAKGTKWGGLADTVFGMFKGSSSSGGSGAPGGPGGLGNLFSGLFGKSPAAQPAQAGQPAEAEQPAQPAPSAE